MGFLKKPFLPEHTVSHVIINQRYFDLLEKPLLELGITVFKAPILKNIDSRVEAHPDMMMFCAMDRIYCAPEIKEELENTLCGYVFEVIAGEKNPFMEYPKDILYNCLQVGPCFLHNLSFTEPKILTYAKENRCIPVNVTQGYTKCSVAVINEHALITADRNIAYTCQKFGIDVLLIREGDFLLDGFSHGFIGGCCGMIDRDKICFTGKIDHHADYEKIMSFLNKHQVTAFFLTQQKAVDIGSIIPIMEKEK